MSSPIFESLPAIHVTIVGVVTAFFSAFAIFAYQKLYETKDKLEKVLKDVEVFETPDNFVGGSDTKFITDEGLLDWEREGFRVLHKAKSMFSYLDLQAKYGYEQGYIKEPSAEEIIQIGDDLLLLLHYVFTTYPFNGSSMVNIQGITEKIEIQKSRSFDDKRLSEMASRIAFLSWCWRTSDKSILELANRYTALKEAAQLQYRDEEHQRILNSLPEGMSQERVDELTKSHYENQISRISYVKIVSDYFEKVMQYQSQVLPVLEKTVTEHKLYNERFEIKKWSLLVIKLVVFTLALGVCMPLIIMEVLHGAEYFNWNSFWVSWFELFVLLLTMSPYFIACRYFYGLVQKWPFK